MRWKTIITQETRSWVFVILLVTTSECAKLNDVLLSKATAKESIRVARDSNKYGARSGSTDLTDRKIKPEESIDSQDNKDTNVGKRCIRCDSGYLDFKYPYDSRNRQDDRYDRYDYDDRRYDDRYERYDYYDKYDRGRDYYDRYDRNRYDNRDSYDRDRYYKDRYPPYDRDRLDRDRPGRNRLDRDRPDRDRNYRDRYPYNERDHYDRGGYDRGGYERGGYDRPDRDRYDRRDRYSDRGIGYDNRGYDYRERNDRDGYRPWDETYRGTSGFDSSGRGYYFAIGKPESGYSGGGYASNWNYGGGDRTGKGYLESYYRPRDDIYRGTSYLYGRPAEETTVKTNNTNTNTTSETTATQSTQGESSG